MRKHIPFLIVLLGLSAAYGLISHYSTEGYILVDGISINGNEITIASGCKAIIADTSPERALAIQTGLEKTIDERPLTHDTFAQVLNNFNITLDAVKLQRYDGRYYYSDIILSDGKKVLTLDAMPSDAIALAIRMKAPIYVNQTLLSEIGQKIC